MSVFLLILGFLSVAAGGSMIAFGVPINEFGLGNTLIVAGVTALVGGFIVIGLSAVVRKLDGLAEVFASNRPMPRSSRPADVPDARVAPARPVPRPQAPRAPVIPDAVPAAEARSDEPRVPAPSVDLSAAAIDRLRARFPRPERDQPSSAPVVTAEAPTLPAEKAEVAAPEVLPAGPAGDAAQQPADQEKEKPWRIRAREREQRQRERAVAAALQSPPAPAKPAVDERPQPPAPPPSAEPVPVQILKSGVVDGMAYTLFSDGSIEAKLPEGTMRFGSIADLRAHLEGQENAAGT